MFKEQDSIQMEPAMAVWLNNFQLLFVCLTFTGHCMLFIWWHTSSRPTFPRLKKYCASIPPIAVIEYESRRTKLSHTLHDLNVSAYITEPSSNGLYFANISTSEWSLSERPLLIVITPEHQTMNYGEKSSIIIKSRLTILTPKFESARAKLLPISVTLSNEVHFVQYAEEENPYDVLLDALSKYPDWNPNRTVVVDENMRHFVATGLTSSGARIRPHSQSIRRIRERKSPAELDILRGANEVTLLAIREVREKMRIGMTESEGRDMMHTALRSAGLREVWALVLFGENAALPHGSGTDRILTEHDLVLIDAGGSLHGYNSDVTRTFALPKSKPSGAAWQQWSTVRRAQEAAFQTAKFGVRASVVDEVARVIVDPLNYGYFTHRLGHGIGVDGHEAPYLVGGNGAILEVSNTFSIEPGFYVPGVVGIRLEDCVVIGHDGNAELLTAGVGGFATDPWNP